MPGYRVICHKIFDFVETAAFVLCDRYDVDDEASRLAGLSLIRVSIRLIKRVTSYQVMLSASVDDMPIRLFLKLFL